MRDYVSIARLAVIYVEYAKAYFAYKEGNPTSEVSIIQRGLKLLIRRFGCEKVNAFGPCKLKMVWEDMISRKLARTAINKANHHDQLAAVSDLEKYANCTTAAGVLFVASLRH